MERLLIANKTYQIILQIIVMNLRILKLQQHALHIQKIMNMDAPSEIITGLMREKTIKFHQVLYLIQRIYSR